MAYGFDEFPFTSLHESNLLQIHYLYKKLKEEYDGLVSRMSAMETTQAGFPAEITKQVTQQVDSKIQQYKNDMEQKLSQALEQMKQTESRLESDFNQLNSTTDAWTEKWNKELIDHENKLDKQLEDFMNQTLRWESKFDQKIADAKAEFTEMYEEHRAKLRSIVNTLIAHVKNMLKKYEDENAVFQEDLTTEVAKKFESYFNEIMDMEHHLRDIDFKFNQLNQSLSELTTAVNDWKPSGRLTVPMTGEVKEANEALADVYYSLLANMIPSVGEMNAYSPNVEDMDNQKERLWRTSTNHSGWYEPPFINPITGQHQSLQGILSAIQQSVLQATNEAITKAGALYGGVEGAEYGELKRSNTFIINPDDGLTYLGKAFTKAAKSANVYMASIGMDIPTNDFTYFMEKGAEVVTFIALWCKVGEEQCDVRWRIDEREENTCIIFEPVLFKHKSDEFGASFEDIPLQKPWKLNANFVIMIPEREEV